MDIDWRILIVISPLLIAGSWALFNIGKVAIGQVQEFLGKQS